MAKRSLRKIIEDVATGVAYSLASIYSGRTLSLDDADKGLLAFSYRDKDDKAVLPKLNNEGAVVVSTDAGTCVPFSGKVLEGSLVKDTEALIATIPLTVDTDYSRTTIIMSSFREFEYRITKVDDAAGTPVLTDIASGIVGDGDNNENVMPSNHCFTSDSTGTQELRVYATPVEANPDTIHAHGSINEIV